MTGSNLSHDLQNPIKIPETFMRLASDLIKFSSVGLMNCSTAEQQQQLLNFQANKFQNAIDFKQSCHRLVNSNSNNLFEKWDIPGLFLFIFVFSTQI